MPFTLSVGLNSIDRHTALLHPNQCVFIIDNFLHRFHDGYSSKPTLSKIFGILFVSMLTELITHNL